MVSNHANAPGFAVVLTGRKIDLDAFRDLLPPPFSPWVEDYSEPGGLQLLLRTTAWNSLTDPAEVFRDLLPLIERLNGLVLLAYDDARPVTPGGTYHFWPDGRRDIVMRCVSATFNITLGRCRVRGISSTAGPPSEPAESVMQRRLREVHADPADTKRDLLAYLTKADNWYDLYKVMELVRRLVGDEVELNRARNSAPLRRRNAGVDQQDLITWLGGDKSIEGEEWLRVWKTANNCNRHAPDPIVFPPPPVPATFNEARRFVLRIVERLL